MTLLYTTSYFVPPEALSRGRYKVNVREAMVGPAIVFAVVIAVCLVGTVMILVTGPLLDVMPWLGVFGGLVFAGEALRRLIRLVRDSRQDVVVSMNADVMRLREMRWDRDRVKEVSVSIAAGEIAVGPVNVYYFNPEQRKTPRFVGEAWVAIARNRGRRHGVPLGVFGQRDGALQYANSLTPVLGMGVMQFERPVSALLPQLVYEYMRTGKSYPG